MIVEGISSGWQGPGEGETSVGERAKKFRFFVLTGVNFLDFSLTEIGSAESPCWFQMNLLLAKASASFFVPPICKSL